jgi:hypothetical protein
MKNPAYEQIARKVKARLRMLQHAQRISGNVSKTAGFLEYRGRSITSGKSAMRGTGSWSAGFASKTKQDSLSYSTRDRVAHPSHSGRASLRRCATPPLSSTALPRLLVTDVEDAIQVIRSVSEQPNYDAAMKRLQHPHLADY